MRRDFRAENDADRDAAEGFSRAFAVLVVLYQLSWIVRQFEII